jgi:glycosyltransferase involved in cell wall biosynthesis
MRGASEPWRVAIVHNRYQQAGGEDTVFAAESSMLEAAGHHVVRHEVHNDAVREMPRLELAARTIWNPRAYRDLTDLFRRERVDVVHVHNTLPLISPAVYGAARRAGAAVVQTLHNFRLLCPAATLYRDGTTCELCVGKAFAWPGIRHACYRSDRAATATIATMLLTHKSIGTYRTSIDRYIALTDFAKRKFVEGGLPAARIVVKPNSAANMELRDPTGSGPALYVGRLSDEKGVRVMLEAWREADRLPRLHIVGDGPLRKEVDAAADHLASVASVGRVPPGKMASQYQAASMLVFPSTCFEGFPLAVVEAMAAGLPVIASRLGSMPEIVQDGRTGLLFDAGNASDLRSKVRWLCERPEVAAAMGREARVVYEARYTPERNLARLLEIYGEAFEASRPATR